jgi:hypothetical protein
VSDADAFHRGKGDVCMSERRYLNDPKEILERPIVDPTNSLQFTVYENYNVDYYSLFGSEA